MASHSVLNWQHSSVFTSKLHQHWSDRIRIWRWRWMTWKKTRKWTRNKLLEKLYPVRGRFFHSLVSANFHFQHHHRQEIIKSSKIVIFEPRFDRSAERTRRMSRPLLNSLADASRRECPRQYGTPGYLRAPPRTRLWERVKSMHRDNLGFTPGLHEYWCDFTVRQFLDEIRPLHVRPNAGRYVQHWVIYKWNSSCPPTSFLQPPLSVTATHHFQKLIPLHVFLSLEGKKEGYFDKRKICWSNSIRRSRSVYDKISQDSKMSVIHMIIG